MRLHVLGLPWTETTQQYAHCAYSQKALRFCDMMTMQGHEVFLYAGEKNDADCAEHVQLLSRDERVGWFGEWDPNNLFQKIDWNPASPWWQTFNSRAIEAVRERAQPHDIVCLLTRTQDSIAEAHPSLMPVEWAVGYEGIRTTPYPSGTPSSRVFESYAWMHYLYGKWGYGDGFPFDTVIPNFFDPDDFHQGDGDGGYLVFLGRLVWRKGPQVAAAIAERVGMPIKFAGPGATTSREGAFSIIDGPSGVPQTITGSTVEYVGPVDIQERANLLAGAAAIIVPTLYIEPFGGVAVEAMMAGTPVVASDWGAFTETVEPDITGYRFGTLAEGVFAVEQAIQLDRFQVRQHAVERFSLATVGPMFTEHFDRLDTLWRDGWYEDAPSTAAVD